MRSWATFFLLAGMLVPARSEAILSWLWKSRCREELNADRPQDDALAAALRAGPTALRKRLFRAAFQHSYDLSRVLLPEAAGTLRWLRTQLRETEKSIRWLPRRRERAAYLARLGEELDTALAKPERLDFATYQQLAGRFVRAVVLARPDAGVPGAEQPFQWSGRRWDMFSGIPAPAMLPKHDGALAYLFGGRERELEEYVLLPLAQSSIDLYVDSDLFLSAWGHRVYPLGITAQPRAAHRRSALLPADAFYEHDLMHAETSYEAYKLMQWLAQHAKSTALREWYAQTWSRTDEYVDAYLREKNLVTDERLRVSIGAIGWSFFHEGRVPFNPLDAAMLAQLNLDERTRSSLDTIPHRAELYDTYGMLIRTTEALEWHRSYWESQLPKEPETRAALRLGYEALLRREGRLYD